MLSFTGLGLLEVVKKLVGFLLLLLFLFLAISVTKPGLAWLGCDNVSALTNSCTTRKGSQLLHEMSRTRHGRHTMAAVPGLMRSEENGRKI